MTTSLLVASSASASALSRSARSARKESSSTWKSSTTTSPKLSVLGSSSINSTSLGRRAERYCASSSRPSSVKARFTAVVLPIPEGPSTTSPLPGVRRFVSKVPQRLGRTKVTVGTPPILKTVSSPTVARPPTLCSLTTCCFPPISAHRSPNVTPARAGSTSDRCYRAISQPPCPGPAGNGLLPLPPFSVFDTPRSHRRDIRPAYAVMQLARPTPPLNGCARGRQSSAEEPRASPIAYRTLTAPSEPSTGATSSGIRHSLNDAPQ